MNGIDRKTRFVAFLIVCLVVASATTQAGAKSPVVKVTTGLNTVNLRFTTPQPTSVTLNMGATKSYGLTVLDSKRRTHSLTVRGLRPETNYYYALKAVPAKGKVLPASGSFRTGRIGAATISRSAGNILLNGVRFAPITVSGYNCATESYVTGALALRANVLEMGDSGEPCESSVLHGALKNRIWWYSKDLDKQQQIADLPELLRGSAGIYEPKNPGSLMGLFDALNNRCGVSPARTSIVVSEKLDAAHQNNLTPEWLKMLFWMNYAACGQVVQYYARGDTYESFSVLSALAPQAAKEATKQATLSPAILYGQTVKVVGAQTGPIRARAWRYGGVTYVLAVNLTQKVEPSTFVLTGVRGGRAQVLWENRSIPVGDGRVAETFQPLAVHIYKIVPALGVK